VDLGGVKKVTLPYSILGQWHHFALTWRAISGTWRFYVDGNPVDAGQGLRPKTDIPVGGIMFFGTSASFLGQDKVELGGGDMEFGEE
jgi:hypothetical protein